MDRSTIWIRGLLGAALLGGISILSIGAALAQQPADPATPQSSFEKTTKDGIPLGSFFLNPGLTLSETYDDNIFATPRNRVGDFITTVSPALALKSNWSRHMLRIESGADIGRHADRDSENFNDYHVSSDGRFDLTDSSNLFGGASFNRSHESRESPDNINGTVPTTFNDIRSHLGMSTKIGSFFSRFGGTFEQLNFDNLPSATGTINNKDRNRDVYELGVRAGYTLPSDFQLFVQGTHNWRNYLQRMDDNGFDRKSSGYSVAAGAGYDGPGRLTGEVYFGYLSQDYRDPRLADVGVPDFGGDLAYKLTDATRVTGFANRSVEETTISGASSYLATTAGLRLDHALKRDLTAQFVASFSKEEFQGTGRTDDVSTIGAGAKYFLLPQIFVGADYRFQRRDSNEPSVNYDDNQIFLRLGAQAARGYNENAPEAQQDQGFYGGIQGNLDNVNTKLDGPRGAGGTLDGNFGGFGFGGSLFGGYGAIINQWYLGLELDGDNSSAEWNHAREPGGRIFSVEMGDSVGGSARFGRVLKQGSLLYGLVGAVRTRFTTPYQTASGRSFDQTTTQTGIRMGAGIETPISRRYFLRLQYTHTDYNDYDVTVPSGTDNFDNSDNTLSLGLVYRLFDQSIGDQNGPDVPATRFDGFYGGLQVGHGTITSFNQGPRESGSTLTADRGGDGPAGGAFGGYGTTWKRFYVGAEVDGGGDGQNWQNTRDPTGRVYSVQKVAHIGASARLGYVLGPGALVYGRIGPVLSIFDTKYVLSPTSVDQDNAELGLRYGGGIEAPINEKMFVRIDYAYSTYGTYAVNYSAGIDTFKNRDSQFSLGLLYRF